MFLSVFLRSFVARSPFGCVPSPLVGIKGSSFWWSSSLAFRPLWRRTFRSFHGFPFLPFYEFRNPQGESVIYLGGTISLVRGFFLVSLPSLSLFPPPPSSLLPSPSPSHRFASSSRPSLPFPSHRRGRFATLGFRFENTLALQHLAFLPIPSVHRSPHFQPSLPTFLPSAFLAHTHSRF